MQLIHRQQRVVGRRLKRLIVTSVVLLGLLSTANLAASASPTAAGTTYEYFFVIDTSKSMIGYAGSPVIFPKVKHAVSDYISALDQGNTELYVYQFAKGLVTPKPFRTKVSSVGDKKRAQGYVNGIQAKGDYTWIYQSLNDVLAQADAVRRNAPSVHHVQTIFLFTDGNNNGPVSLGDTLRRLKLSRADNPYLFLRYVTLGTTADSGWSGVPGVEVQNTPAGTAPQLYSVRIKPPLLDFGSLRDRASSDRVVQIEFDPRLSGKSISLSADAKDAEAKGAFVRLSPNTVVLTGPRSADGFDVMTQSLSLSIENKDSLSDSGAYGGNISFSSNGVLISFSPQQMNYTFDVTTRSAVEVVAPDRETLGADLGMLDPYRAKGPVERQLPVQLVFNDRSRSAGGYVLVHVAQTSGAKGDAVRLVDAAGRTADQLQVGPDSPKFTIAITAKNGSPAGLYAYQVVLEPHAATLVGKGITSESDGSSAFAVRFSVPPRPEPAWKGLVRGLLWALAALILLALAAVIGIALKSGTSPARVVALVFRKLGGTMLDARVEVVQPYEAAATIELTGRKSVDLGAGTQYIPALPFTLRFQPDIDVTAVEDRLSVRVVPDDAGSFLLHRATADFDEPTVRSSVATGDRIRVDGSDGQTYELVVQSFKYTGV